MADKKTHELSSILKTGDGIEALATLLNQDPNIQAKLAALVPGLRQDGPDDDRIKPVNVLQQQQQGASEQGRPLKPAGGGGFNDKFQDQFKSKLVECSKCGRNFAPDRIQTHENACKGPVVSVGRNSRRSSANEGDQSAVAALSGGLLGSPEPAESPVEKPQVERPRPVGGGSGGFNDRFQDSFKSKLVECSKCGRNFAPDRIATHENACKGPTSTVKSSSRRSSFNESDSESTQLTSALSTGSANGGSNSGGGGGGGPTVSTAKPTVRDKSPAPPSPAAPADPPAEKEKPKVTVSGGGFNDRFQDQFKSKLVECSKCGRNFAPDRIATHENACKGASASKTSSRRTSFNESDANASGVLPTVPASPLVSPQKPSEPLEKAEKAKPAGGGSGGFNDRFQEAFKSKLSECSKCGRSFAPDRINTHENVCKGATASKTSSRRTSFNEGDSTNAQDSSASDPHNNKEKVEKEKEKPKSGGFNDRFQDAFKSKLVECSKCGRNFAPDRIAKHEGACKGPTAPLKSSSRRTSEDNSDQAEAIAAALNSNSNGKDKEMTSKPRSRSSSASNSNPRTIVDNLGSVQAALEDREHHPPVTTPKKAGGGGGFNDRFQDSFKSKLVECSKCGRNFAPDRIVKHESVCKAVAKDKDNKEEAVDEYELCDKCNRTFPTDGLSAHKAVCKGLAKRGRSASASLDLTAKLDIPTDNLIPLPSPVGSSATNQSVPPRKNVNLSVVAPASANNSVAPSPRSAGPASGGGFNDRFQEAFKSKLVSCSKCGRNFAPERIKLHEDACKGTGVSTGAKKRSSSQSAPAGVRGVPVNFDLPGKERDRDKELVDREREREAVKEAKDAKEREAKDAKDAKDKEAKDAKEKEGEKEKPKSALDKFQEKYQNKLVPCKVCNRKFDPTRVAKHEAVCKDFPKPQEPEEEPDRPELSRTKTAPAHGVHHGSLLKALDKPFLDTKDKDDDDDSKPRIRSDSSGKRPGSGAPVTPSGASSVEQRMADKFTSKLVACSKCGRKFHPGVVGKHEASCKEPEPAEPEVVSPPKRAPPRSSSVSSSAASAQAAAAAALSGAGKTRPNSLSRKGGGGSMVAHSSVLSLAPAPANAEADDDGEDCIKCGRHFDSKRTCLVHEATCNPEEAGEEAEDGYASMDDDDSHKPAAKAPASTTGAGKPSPAGSAVGSRTGAISTGATAASTGTSIEQRMAERFASKLATCSKCGRKFNPGVVAKHEAGCKEKEPPAEEEPEPVSKPVRKPLVSSAKKADPAPKDTKDKDKDTKDEERECVKCGQLIDIKRLARHAMNCKGK